MNPSALKQVALGLLAALLFLAAWAVVQARSQAILDTRYPLRATAVRADASPEAVAQGQHLVQTSGCALCHGRDLAGKLMGAAGSPLAAPNLTRVVAKRTDAELDRAIRQGLRREGTSEFGMPSHVYAAFTDQETAAILGYLRSLKPEGRLVPRAEPGMMQRVDLAVGFMHPEAGRVADARRPIPVGPAFEAGRHLAALSCGQCHGTDLSSGHGAPGPDLMVRGGYSLKQFRALMRSGETPSGLELDLMSETARLSFSHFTDPEINALYAYLYARDVRLDAAPKKGG